MEEMGRLGESIMAFKFEQTEMEGLIVITPHMFPDERGLYKKCYEKNIYRANGITEEFGETSDIYSQKGALRGLHYQTEEAQAKLIHVISGTLFDVALDLRVHSKTFGKYHTELLKAEEQKVLYIPSGFAHGFISLEDNTIFSYQCSGKYIPEACGGIRWDDEELNIPWPLKEYGIDNVIATAKDRNWPCLSEYKKEAKI